MAIIKCDCVHKGQDELHGQGKRVMNPTMKENIFRCTVCGKEQTKGERDGG